MEILKQTPLTQEEKEALIQRIWEDKGGRVDRNRSLAMYISLDSPKPDLTEITRGVIGKLSENSVLGFNWAEDWGRVVICVGPGGRLDCILGDTNEDKNKRFVPVHTTRQLSSSEMQELVDQVPGGNAGIIMLNNQPSTIEAFLISYVHMVDQLIWSIYRNLLQDNQEKNPADLYRKAMELVKHSGFSTRLASEDEILASSLNDPKISVRLYGSGVNRDVPRVMGAAKGGEINQ